ncbi:hypothetical protein GDO86_017832 [Hymenochirus boettgeri]|uniref:G-protein coupled receptors family 1 profile domain-containing protein n=1 Tax=Hymenochirus boettgeri TaxID=247094 RepID=A0A8T2IL21_9PIPI|nr:hypothetical protein GDO86_017832 [Hymenochirus boettgeri]
MENQTVFYMLVLSGLSDLPSLQFPLFLVFLLVYLMTLTGNLLIVLLICTDSHLQTPMYFFLGTWHVGYGLFLKVLLLSVMSYDRYVAICRPLHYTHIMHWKTCILLVLGVLSFSVVYSLVPVLLLLRLSFCSDTFINVLLILILAILLGGGIFALTFCPYIIILNTIMKMSKAMRSKAFSTCSSHLTVVFIFYGTLFFSYFHPNAKTNSAVDKVSSVIYTVLTPLVNPLIYSLRNKIMKISLKRAVCRLIQL